MAYKIKLTQKAQEDLSYLPEKVVDTYLEKKDDAEDDLNDYANAEPDQVFNKRMKDNMHPMLQINMGRDHRAWFIEAKHLNTETRSEHDIIYGIRALTKKQAKKLTRKIHDARAFAERFL